MVREGGIILTVNGGLVPPLLEGSMSYQLVGEVMAHQGCDG